MRKVINGIVCDTEAAKEIIACNDYGTKENPCFARETIFKAKSGQFFLHIYKSESEQNIKLMNRQDVINWLPLAPEYFGIEMPRR